MRENGPSSVLADIQFRAEPDIRPGSILIFEVPEVDIGSIKRRQNKLEQFSLGLHYESFTGEIISVEPCESETALALLEKAICCCELRIISVGLPTSEN